MYCTKCGKELDSNDKFCSHCGKPIETVTDNSIETTELENAVEKFKNGDEVSFEIIYKGVIKTAVILVRSFFPEEESEHEDIIQDIFMHVYKKISLYNPETASFTTWFRKVAENKCIDRYRVLHKKEKIKVVSMESLTKVDNSGRKIEFEDERIEFNPAAVMEKNEMSRLIRELMDRLPEKQRQCLTLKFLAQYEIQEIADKLGIPVGTVKSRLFKGKENLSLQVCEMEKRGIKLYGMSPVAFFVWLLTQDVEVELEAASLPAFHAIQDGINEMKKCTPTETVTNHSLSNEQEPNGICATSHIGSSAAKTVTSKTISTKLVVGILGVAVVAGSGFAISYAFEPDNKATTPIEKPVPSEENIDENISLISLFDDEEKLKQLETILALSPVFDENSMIDAETLWNNVFTKSGINITALKSGTTQLDILPITDLNSIEIDMEKYEIVLPVHAYDIVFQALNISSELLDELSKAGYLHYDKEKLYFNYGQSSIGPYAADVTDIKEVDTTLEVSFALSYDSSDPEVSASQGNEKYVAVLAPSENSLGYIISSIKPAKREASSSMTVYEPLIKAYGQAYYSGLKNLPDILNIETLGLFNPYHGLLELPSEEYPTIYYALYDINDDGYDECFFTSNVGIEKSAYPGYYDIWTNDGFTSRHLMEGGYRTSQMVLENGEILNFGSGGADFGEYSVYSFQPNGDCTLQDTYQYDTYNEDIELEIQDFLEKHPKKDVNFEWIEIPLQ